MDAEDWDRRYTGAELVWSAAPNRFVEAELAGLRPGRAVDVATGEGRNAIWLAQHGWEVAAVDFSEVGLDKGRTLARRTMTHGQAADRITWVHADVLRHDLGSDLDLALLAYLQLVPAQRREAVRRAFLALRVGGTLLVVAHDSSNLVEGIGGPQDASVLYTAEDVLGDLDGEAFDVLRAGRVTRPVPPAGGGPDGPSGTAYDALVRVVRTD